MRLFSAIVLSLLLLLVGFLLGAYYEYWNNEPVIITEYVTQTENKTVYIPVPIPLRSDSIFIYEEPITIEEARDIIQMARTTHQYFVEHPDEIPHDRGLEYEETWVERYNQLENFIMEAIGEQ